MSRLLTDWWHIQAQFEALQVLQQQQLQKQLLTQTLLMQQQVLVSYVLVEARLCLEGTTHACCLLLQ
jgi:hypothetical protein